LKYRAEIDGLRALAVVPVILFHAGFELFSGGFIGVDVFFVISGYLITTILIDDIENKRFSIVNFYERRARRILPALFFMMLICIPFAWMWMLPNQMKDFSQSLVAVSLFASNILFWRESGYFAAAAEEKPLLHTWSLAVEEQYYVLFPIFLILAWRFGKNRVFWMIVVMAAISLMLSEWGWRNQATANFYLAPTRAWELFAGSIAAFIVQKQGVQKNNLLALIGLAAIIFSIFFYDETTPFPSVYALVPVLGVVLLVLYADKETIAARLLSTRGFVGIGLISYSAYLWHQPLFAFARIRSFEHPSLLLMSLLSLTSLVLAYFSWRYVEKPFRNRNQLSRLQILLPSALLLVSFSIVGLIGHLNKGFPNRFDGTLLSTIEQIDDEALRLVGIGCHLDGDIPNPFPTACGVNLEKGEIDVLFIGDSHLDAIGLQLLDRFDRLDKSAYALSYSGCVPISELTRADMDSSFKCMEYNEAVRLFAQANNVNTIVLIGRFPLYLLGERYNNGEGGVETGNSVPVYSNRGGLHSVSNNNSSRMENVLEQYRSDIELLAKDFNVVIFTPTPEVGWDVPNYYAKRVMFDNEEVPSEISITHSYQSYLERTRLFSNVLSSITSENLYIYDISKLFCTENTSRCIANIDSNLLYRDDDHLSHFAANIVANDFVSFYSELLHSNINE
jgi:peptidoglycan/LPS O-acetylase OafA/YrhL